MPILPLPDFSLKLGDTSPPLAITCSYPDGSVQNLTGSTVKFAMWKRTNPASSPKISSGSASIITSTAGTCQYAWSTAGTDTNAAGDYYGEFHVTLSGGRKVSFPNRGYLWIQISPRIST